PLPDVPEAAVPVLAWVDCEGGFQCATATVPLDHDDPTGPTIDLALIKQPATDPAARTGSLFTNPGGPGGSGVGFVRNAAAIFPSEVAATFDIVGFDPRGVGASTPLRCFANSEEQLAYFTSISPSPVTPEEDAASEAALTGLGPLCADRNPEIASHLSTADVARDLHLLMQAVGDDALNYYGLSYGTYLGATFANLFPGEIRTLILDGVVEPNDYTGTEDDAEPTFVRAGSNVGSSDTLDAFLDLCAEAGEAGCAFAAGGDPRQKFAEIAEGLREGPVTLPVPELPGGSVEITFGVLIGLTVNNLYADVNWPLLAAALEDVYRNATPTSMARLVSTMQAAAVAPYSNQPEALRAIVCADTANPGDPSAWPELAAAADEETPFVGGYWAYVSQQCADWPIETEDNYTGPFDATTANPALVIGTRFDPATPYANSEALAAELPGARLLTLEGYGHTSFGQGACISGEVTKYLVTGEVPAEGATCFPDRRPFDALPTTPGAQATAAARASLMPYLPIAG
ncbi:MAG: alpha/beta fold hydrolase, partial [Pseudonocardia sp.]|nr:alpha/beta fold hydrolase [Pseudonocardia sp.]